MKIFHLLFVIVLLVSCGEVKKDIVDIQENSSIIVSEFQSMLDSALVNGSILVYDLSQNKYFSNNFEWAQKGHLPASTYKIPNSIIALETGVVKSDKTLFKWDGQARQFKSWEQDLAFTDAFKLSCVPCYQEIARDIGHEVMSNFLDTLNYGNIDVNASNIDMFWLEGNSRISQYQQIDFLKRFNESKLPISDRTESIVKQMMVLDINDESILRGKTGWSIDDGKNNGWFVGYLETKSNIFYFSSNFEPKAEFDMKDFPRIRKELTMKALKKLYPSL